MAKPVIWDLSAEFKQGEHVALIGKVGAGKSSLLLAILGEVPVVSGSLCLKHGVSISYAEQEPLIVTGTIQDNITFGSELDPDWYLQVVQACALDEDIRQMPSGDQTKLGEMGHNLSGG